MKKKKNNLKDSISGKQISRKEWIAGAGKYAAFTAATMMFILDPVKKAAAQSDNLPVDPGGGGDPWGNE